MNDFLTQVSIWKWILLKSVFFNGIRRMSGNLSNLKRQRPKSPVVPNTFSTRMSDGFGMPQFAFGAKPGLGASRSLEAISRFHEFEGHAGSQRFLHHRIKIRLIDCWRGGLQGYVLIIGFDFRLAHHRTDSVAPCKGRNMKTNHQPTIKAISMVILDADLHWF